MVHSEPTYNHPKLFECVDEPRSEAVKAFLPKVLTTSEVSRLIRQVLYNVSSVIIGDTVRKLWKQ